MILDSHKYIIEVMGNPPGQRADNLHFIRLK